MSTSTKFAGTMASTLAMALTATAAAQPPAGTATAPVRSDNYYAAGNELTVAAPMGADVIVAGRQINIKARVAGDILAAGWRVNLSGTADDDVRMAGGEITVNAPVTGDVTLAGGDVTLGADAHIGGRSWVTGRTVRVAGIFDRDLQIAGETVQISGEARQPVRVIAEKLEVLPGARILAGLSYKSPTEARVAEGATIVGPIRFDRVPEREARQARAFPTASSLLFALHLFVAGLLVIFFLPRLETSVVETLRTRPGRSLLAGFALLVTTPVAALILIASVFGLPIGLALAACYAVALFLGLLMTAFYIGEAEARLLNSGPIVARGQHVWLLCAGVVTLAVLRSLFGGVVVFAGVIFGLGAVALWIYGAYSRPVAAASA